MKRRLMLIVPILVAGAGATWWILNHEESGGEALVLYGNVDVREAELGFRVGGRLAEILVEEGDHVTPGQLLARLDPEPFEESLAHREALLAKAKANLTRLEAGFRPEKIRQAEAVVAEREALLENAEVAFRRQQELVKNDNTTRAAYDAALARLRTARAELKTAQAARDLARAGFRQEDVAAGRAAVAAAAAEVEIARTALADTGLHAPRSGIILARVREPGTVLAPGETVLTLSIDDPVWVRAFVPEPGLGLVHPGMAAEVRTDSRPDKVYRGHVGFISPSAEFTPKTVETPELRTALVYRLRVIVDNPDQGLRQGMPVTVRLLDGPDAASGAR
ncbi:MAG: secretion protein HlyD [Rhodothalassiaceae bacterium]